MTRDHGWLPIGERVTGHVPRNRGKVLTVLGALTLNGVEAMMTIEGGTSGAVFLRFVRDHQLPILRLGAWRRWTPARAPRYGRSRRRPRSGAEILNMPPYSPDLNPVEICWSKFKVDGARTVKALRAAVTLAAQTVTCTDAEGCPIHCGYPAPCDRSPLQGILQSTAFLGSTASPKSDVFYQCTTRILV